MTAAALHCGNCSAPLQVLHLPGHYGKTVELDLCAPCHLVWFDSVEAARLAGPGLLDLIGAMAAAHSLAHQPLRPDLHCPRCNGAVRTVHNRTRWGPSLQLECVHRHGAWQTFAQFLSEKGLLRPMSFADRQRALQSAAGQHCVNCGGAIGAKDAQCPWCQSVPALVDVARLAQALDPEGATATHAVHGIRARGSALGCQACGAALPPDAVWTCAQCGTTITAPDLAGAHAQIAPLAEALHDHARRPAPAVVRRRLQGQDAGLQRQRERAAEMQAEADARTGTGRWNPQIDEDALWHALLEQLRRRPLWFAAGAAVVALWWWLR